jgi:capsular exopolysaccharide synthesis family protein
MTSTGPRLLSRGIGYDAEHREDEFRRIQAQVIKSRAVLGKVLERPAIQKLTTIRELEYPEIWLEKELKAISMTGTDFFKISLSGQEPGDVTAIVNAVKDVFVNEFVDDTDKKQSQRLDNIGKALAAEGEKIKEKRRNLMNEVQTSGSGDPTSLNLKQKWLLEEYGILNRALIDLDTNILTLKALQTVQKGTKDYDELEAILIEEYLDKHSKVEIEKHEITKVEMKIKDLRKRVNEDNPHLAKLRGELEDAKKQLEKVKVDLQPEAKKKAEVLLERQWHKEMKFTEKKLKVMEGQREVLKEKVKLLYEKADQIGKGSFTIELLKAELAETQDIARSLRKEQEHLSLELLHNFNNEGDEFTNKGKVKGYVPLNIPAVVPTVNEASLVKNMSLFSLAGLALGFFGVSYVEARVRRLHRPADVHQELGIKTLGVLPLLAQLEGRVYGQGLPNQSPPGIMFTEAVNGLCASLLCDDRLCRGAVLMVTSASENEGKTLLATQLAAGLARTGRRTLLLDGDLRNSRCREQLGLAEGPGLSEVLRGEAELEAALQNMPESEARVLTAGKSCPQVLKALSNGGFAALLARLRQEFDCVIIDSAPTLVVADGLLIGKLTDGVILVVRPKVSKAPAVYSAYEQLTGLQIRTLGAVVNANPARASSSYYVRY